MVLCQHAAVFSLLFKDFGIKTSVRVVESKKNVAQTRDTNGHLDVVGDVNIENVCFARPCQVFSTMESSTPLIYCKLL